MIKRIAVILGVSFVACIAFALIVFGGAWYATRYVGQTGDNFMTALQEKRFEDAYGMFSSELQAEVTADAFRETFSGAAIAGWSFTSRSIRNDNGELSGTATLDDKEFHVQLHFVKQDGTWHIIGYDFSPAS